MGTQMRRHLLLGAAVSAALVLAGCSGGGGQTAAAPEGPATPVRVILTSAPNGSNSELYLAQERGYYAEEGLDVQIVPGTDSQAAITAVTRGDAEIGLISTSFAVPNASQGNTVVAVGNRIGKHTFGVLVPEDSPVRSFKDLEGKTLLAFSSQIGEELKAVMRAQGANPDAVTVALIAPASLLSSYAGGQGDGLLTSVPFAQPVNATRPSRPLLFADNGMAIPDYAYSASPEYVAQNADTIRRFLTATYKAMGEARQDPTAAAAVFAAQVPGANPTNAEAQLTAMGEYSCADGATGKTLAAFVPADWDRAVAAFGEMGLLKGPVTATDLYTDQFADTTTLTCPLPAKAS
jgi:NitT/TauT family transport system substrate-binding protein